MKRVFLIVLLSVLCYAEHLTAGDAAAQIMLQHKKGGPRSEVPAIMPEAFIDYFERVIIIDGGDDVSFYDVEITSAFFGYYELATQVNGTYDTFDVSSLPAGTHVITLTSPLGDVYEGTFTTY